jgi:hypothetical protein
MCAVRLSKYCCGVSKGLRGGYKVGGEAWVSVRARERKKSEAGACLSFPERWGPCRDVPDRGDGQKDKAAGGKPFWLCTKNVKSHCVWDADGRLILHACSRLFECGRYAIGRAA